MLQSMTGFASRTFEFVTPTGAVSVAVHLKSLNGRFFEASCKLPYALSHLETLLLKKLKEGLVRGTVQCSVFVSSPLTQGSRPVASPSIVEGYLKAARAITEQFGESFNLNGQVDINTILTLPYAIEFAEGGTVDTVASTVILDFVETAMEDLIKERTREGAALEVDLAQRFETVNRALDEIKVRAKNVIEAKRAKLLTNLTELLAQVAEDNKDHYIQLVYGQLEKLDINEEIVRLGSHIASAKACFEGPGVEKGKRFDFILQEMFREINTIGAKCADSELSSLVITIKVELEKSREQIQNIV
ncbi:TPA: YicC family protein [Candidatus Dependentiae bacterium]|nr:MAG: YicC-like protein domain-containing protein [candidate division TM6 bacterium GW2011_GWF2_43_87]HBL98659.1 YicC family protein [Candidatus Dependentiae bacterium]